jgi:hypothetical protein
MVGGWRRDAKLKINILPRIQVARSRGARTLDEIWNDVRLQLILEQAPGRPMSRITCYRALKRLAELGLDQGVDSRVTAWEVRRKSVSNQVVADMPREINEN